MRSSFSRKGYSLLEVSIITALTASLAMIGFTTSREMLPRFRTRKAAAEFAHTVQMARQLAVTSNRETRVLMVEYDANATDPSALNRGMYRIQMGNRASASSAWDTLPLEDGAQDDLSTEGTYDLSRGGNNYLKGVSIEDWGTLTGPGIGNSDALVFNSSGVLTNPASDFDSDGSLAISFVNKYSLTTAGLDRAKVRVYRGGMVRIDNGLTNSSGGGGIASTSTYNNSDGDGYVDAGEGRGEGGDGGSGSGGVGSTTRTPKDLDEDIDEVIRDARDGDGEDDGSGDHSGGDEDDGSGEDHHSGEDDRSDDDGREDDNSSGEDGGDEGSGDQRDDENSGEDDESDHSSGDDDHSSGGDDQGSGGDEGSEDAGSEDDNDHGSGEDEGSEDGGDHGSSDDEGSGGGDETSGDDESADSPPVDQDPTIDEYLADNGLSRNDFYRRGADDDDINDYFGNDGTVSDGDAAKAEADARRRCRCSSASDAGGAPVALTLLGLLIRRRRDP